MIPIKVTVLFVSVKSSELCFFSLCFVVLTLKNKLCHLSVDSVIVFYINTIIYSLKISFKPEFLSSAEHTCWMWKTKQLLVLSDFHSIFLYPCIFLRVKVMDWPSMSPDLNPIEYLWGILKRKVEERKVSNIHQLRDVIMEEWKRTPVATCEALVNSVPKWVEAVLENNGGHTKTWDFGPNLDIFT